MKKRVNTTTTTRVLSADSIRVNGDDMMDGGGDYDEFNGDLPLDNGEVSESDASGDDHNISVENRNNTCGNFEDVDKDNNFNSNSLFELDSFNRLGLADNDTLELESDDDNEYNILINKTEEPTVKVRTSRIKLIVSNSDLFVMLVLMNFFVDKFR